jgi:cell division protease FtsH
MSILIPETDLPAEMTPDQAVEAAYASELAAVAGKLARGLPCLAECDEEFAPLL